MCLKFFLKFFESNEIAKNLIQLSSQKQKTKNTGRKQQQQKNKKLSMLQENCI